MREGRQIRAESDGPSLGKVQEQVTSVDPCPRRSRKWAAPRDILCGPGKAQTPSCAQSTGWRCVSGPVLFWVAMVVVVLVGSSSFLLCCWKTCRRRIQQSKCMCLGVLGRMAALCWPDLSTSTLLLPLNPTPGVFAEFHLDYLAQTLQPKVEPAGECSAELGQCRA